jgi:hypothetical protein
VFAATGVVIDDERQAAIARHSARWRFDFLSDVDRATYDALRAAARSQSVLDAIRAV